MKTFHYNTRLRASRRPGRPAAMLLHCPSVACPGDAARSAAGRCPPAVARHSRGTHRGAGHTAPRAVVLASPHTATDDDVAEEVLEAWLLRPACASDLPAVAQLRASCFYETLREQQSLPFPSRFLPTFEREFADRELRSLRQRTQAPVGSSLACTCLVALSRDTDAVCGCLDVSWRAGPCASTLNGVCVAEVCRGTHTAPVCSPAPGPDTPPLARGVPTNACPCGAQGEEYAYIDNVCVVDTHRRGGVASALMAASSACARDYGACVERSSAANPGPGVERRGKSPCIRPSHLHPFSHPIAQAPPRCWPTCMCTTPRRGPCMAASASPRRRWT